MSNSASAERRSYFVFSFYFSLLANNLLTILDSLASTDIKTVQKRRTSMHFHRWLFQDCRNITPIFSRRWLDEDTSCTCLYLTADVSLRNACDIRRACKPTLLSPMSPSISAFRCQSGYGVYYNDIDSGRTNELFCYFQCLFSIVWL